MVRHSVFPSLAVVGLVVALTFTALPADASTPRPGRQIWDAPPGTPTAVTQELECTVLETLAEERILVVEDEWGREHAIHVPEDARLRAENRRMFDGQRRLEFEQLRAGHRIELTVLRETGEVTRVEVLEPEDEES